jgi:mediator of RNA polymerase II transcription subunit 14
VQSPMAGSPSVVGGPRPSPRNTHGLSSPAQHHGQGGGGGGGGTGTSTSNSLQHSSSFNTRLLPQRLWAGAHPTPLTLQAFDDLCKPAPTPSPGPGLFVPPSSQTLSPLHCFLGCLYLRRHLQSMVRQEFSIGALQSADQSMVSFKVESLTCMVSSRQENAFQTLHLKIEQDQVQSYILLVLSESVLNSFKINFQPTSFTPDMLLILEKFFDTRVVVPPYRPNAVTAFIRILQCPVEALKNLIQLMHLETEPALVAQSNYKWASRICMTVPPSAPPIIPLCQPGLVRLKDKMLIFLQLTRANVQLPPGQEPQGVCIPFVYDITLNQMTVAQKEVTPVMNIAQQHLARLTRTGQLNLGMCTIFQSVRDLLLHLTLPNEGPPHTVQQQPPPMGPRPGVPPAGYMQQQQRAMNPAMMMQQGGPRPQMGPGGPVMDPQMVRPQMGSGGPRMVGPGGPQMGPQMGPGGQQFIS